MSTSNTYQHYNVQSIPTDPEEEQLYDPIQMFVDRLYKKLGIDEPDQIKARLKEKITKAKKISNSKIQQVMQNGLINEYRQKILQVDKIHEWVRELKHIKTESDQENAKDLLINVFGSREEVIEEFEKYQTNTLIKKSEEITDSLVVKHIQSQNKMEDKHIEIVNMKITNNDTRKGLRLTEFAEYLDGQKDSENDNTPIVVPIPKDKKCALF